MKRPVLIALAFTSYALAVSTASFAVYLYRGDIMQIWYEAKAITLDTADEGFAMAEAKYESARMAVVGSKNDVVQSATDKYEGALKTVDRKMTSVKEVSAQATHGMTGWVLSLFDNALSVPDQKPVREAQYRAGIINASYDGAMPPPRTLSEIKQRNEERRYAEYSASIEPAVGTPSWTPDQPSVTAEAVLVPRQVTVISSSQEGRIADILVGHGDVFKKGDVLIAYDCTDVEAEAEIARVQKDLTKKKAEGTDQLFKLDIISDLDRLGAEVEDKQAQAKARAFQARMEDCQIRARFDGRVTNRLANPGEYTRTDRVLLEVASNEPLQAEFLVPSKWLRWVNVGAPISILINETDKTYTARIKSIHGEVDPVSQSIQMIATLDQYDDPLLPGMSGQATIDVDAVRNAGIRGYLEAGYAPKR